MQDNAIIRYFVESFQEFRRVTWPTKNQAIRLTLIVIGFSLVTALVLGLLDFGFGFGYERLLNLALK